MPSIIFTFKVFLVCLCLLTKANENSYYEVLGIPEGTEDLNVIKSAYRKQALKYHPDKIAVGSKQYNEEMLIKINEAYDFFVEEEKRRKLEIEAESLSSLSDLLKICSFDLQNLVAATTLIYEKIPVNDRNNILNMANEYYYSESFYKDLNLLFQFQGLMKILIGILGSLFIISVLVGIFAIIGIITSINWLLKAFWFMIKSTFRVILFVLSLFSRILSSNKKKTS